MTPYIVAAGYHTIHLQTFRIRGRDLARVNFQTPTDAVYGALAALLQVPLDAAGDPQDCAIVSTFSTREVRTLSFDEFTAFGAHGVAGATAFGDPRPSPRRCTSTTTSSRTPRRSARRSTAASSGPASRRGVPDPRAASGHGGSRASSPRAPPAAS